MRTPMLYPDGGVVDVFVLERNGSYIVTDFGDALGWLGPAINEQGALRQKEGTDRDVCQTLRIELSRDQLMLRGVGSGALGEAVLRVAQAAGARLRPLVYAAQPDFSEYGRRGGRMAA